MSVIVVMPAFNEAEGLRGFLEELKSSLTEWNPHFIVVNDASTDDTADVLSTLESEGFPVSYESNARNSGHGFSTLRALSRAVESGNRTIVAVDGDGQFSGAGIAHALEAFDKGEADVVEGVRNSRNDPLYRRLVSLATRALVWSKCGRVPPDANTPLRIYRSDILARLLADVPSTSPVPNLVISSLSRQRRLRIVYAQVESMPRRGKESTGSTWGKSRKSLPSKRFVAFCVSAVRSWYGSQRDAAGP